MPVYTSEKVEEVGTTYMESVVLDEENQRISFVSMSSVPENCTIDKAGVILTKDENVGLDDMRFNMQTAQYVAGRSSNSRNFRYTATVSNAGTAPWYARTYLVYTDGSERITVYGDVTMAQLTGQ